MNSVVNSIWFRVYKTGACFTAGLIGSGNLSTVTYLALKDSELDCVYATMACASVAKGITYGAIWPVFVPYACIKATRKPYYIGTRKLGEINDNGFIPHIIPGWKAATDHLK